MNFNKLSIMKMHTLTLFLTGLLLIAAASPLRLVYGIGDTVSYFKLKNFNGKIVSLSDYKTAKGVILIFDCNTCPYSKAYNDRIAALHKTYSPKGFPVITINSNDG